jgi:hypothetical protein
MQASAPHSSFYILSNIGQFSFIWQTQMHFWYHLLYRRLETNTLITVHRSCPTWRILLCSVTTTYPCIRRHEAYAGFCCRSLIWIGEWWIYFITITLNKKCVNKTMNFNYFLIVLAPWFNQIPCGWYLIAFCTCIFKSLIFDGCIALSIDIATNNNSVCLKDALH